MTRNEWLEAHPHIRGALGLVFAMPIVVVIAVVLFIDNLIDAVTDVWDRSERCLAIWDLIRNCWSLIWRGKRCDHG